MDCPLKLHELYIIRVGSNGGVLTEVHFAGMYKFRNGKTFLVFEGGNEDDPVAYIKPMTVEFVRDFIQSGQSIRGEKHGQ